MSKFSVQNLNLWYNDFKALKNISLELPENKISAFIGPSGCGKSTLLKTLNRMNDLVEGCKITGEILLDGESIYGSMDINGLRRRVGMVFQKPNPFPMSVYDNIAFGPRTHGIRSKSRLDEIVEKSLEKGALIKVETPEELEKIVEEMTLDESKRSFICEQGKVLATSETTVLERVFDYLKKWMK